jgi:NAD(P)-dependent dehydrogenase (short-subunit alcohol dehydrogenase family)
VVFEDIDYEQRPYDPWSAYGQSKTADILLAVEITRRWSSAGICANALNPGAIPTNLQRYTGEVLTPVEKRKTPQQGAATSVLLAASPLVAQAGGRYFEDCNEAPVVSEPEMFGGGVNPWAIDPENAQRLWELSIPFVS